MKTIVLSIFRIIKIINYFLYDAIRFARYSNSIIVNGTKSRMTASITYQYHIVEKGLSMPNRRWNFGLANIRALVRDGNRFIDCYGSDNDELRCAVGVLLIYLDEHAAHGIEVPADCSRLITSLAARVPDALPVRQKKRTREEYFSFSNAPFSEFALARASVRNFSETPVPVPEMLRAVEIAKTAPSACNRQATRAYIVQERKKIDDILAFQNGCRGFGHLADKLIILTSNISSFRGAGERNFALIDGGIFAMNLMYALYHVQIGSCPLNAGMSPRNDASVRRLCGIPPEESVFLFIACGYPPEEFDLANSERKRTEEIARLC